MTVTTKLQLTIMALRRANVNKSPTDEVGMSANALDRREQLVGPGEPCCPYHTWETHDSSNVVLLDWCTGYNMAYKQDAAWIHTKT